MRNPGHLGFEMNAPMPSRHLFTTDGDDSNVASAVIFIFYIVAALVLTGWIAVDLYQVSSQPPSRSNWRGRQRICTFSALATLSFATLSYHMLGFLITSYSEWAVARGCPLSHSVSKDDLNQLYLWEWAKTSTLFRDFAASICKELNGSWWWTEHVLMLSMAWNIYKAAEGNDKSNYFCER
jgi:hypothetical protein